MPYYSFVLICHNQWTLTEQAVHTLNESISPSHKAKGIELIIINNGSEDQTRIGVEQLKVKLSQIEIVPIHLTENLGYLIAANIGLSKCRGEVITLLNNDLIFPEKWFDGIVHTLEGNPSVGAAVPFLSYASGPASVGVRFNSISEIKDFAKKFMEDNKNKILFTELIIGACVSIKRELFTLIGGNDFWFGLGWFEDADWSLRACIAGYKIAIVGASFVYHIGNATIGQHPVLVNAAIKASGDKFSKKWAVTSGFDPKKLVGRTVFSKEKHTFPCRIENFVQPSCSDNRDTVAPKKKILFVADWINECSKWRNRLSALKPNMTLNENEDLTIWIPKTYYPENKVKNEVSVLLGGNESFINYHFDEVPPLYILKFLNQFDIFWTVGDDFVNRYFKYLIEESTLNVKLD